MARRVPSAVQIEFEVHEGGFVHEEIVAHVAATDADLLVLGTHGRSGFQRLFLGSVTEKVIRKASCPTLVVPPRAPDVPPDRPVQFKQILCAVDFSDSSLSALVYALMLGRGSRRQLDAAVRHRDAARTPREPAGAGFDIDRIHAAAEAEALRRLRDLVPDAARAYCTIATRVSEGRAYRQVLQQAAEQKADLIVMGVQGRRATDLLMFGSTTHHVVRASACPVLIVRRP